MQSLREEYYQSRAWSDGGCGRDDRNRQLLSSSRIIEREYALQVRDCGDHHLN